MDEQTIYLLVRAVAVLTRRQLAIETLLQKNGVTKEEILEAAGRAPVPQIIPTTGGKAYQKELEAIIAAWS
jgi:hypothetical protein